MTRKARSAPIKASLPAPLAFLPWAVLFLAVFGTYLATLGPCFLDGDSPETVAAAATLGIPHPPGYALWVLLSSLFARIPVGNPAFAVAMGSAFWASLSVLLIAGLAASGIGKDPRALLAGSFLAFSPFFWKEALSPKGGVYTLQVLLTLAFLGVWLKGPGDRLSPRRFLLGCFLYELGNINHWEIQAALLPLFVLFLLESLRGRDLGKGLALGASILLVAATPHLYFPIRGHLHPALDLGAPDNLRRFLDFLFRKVYLTTQEFGGISGAWDPGILRDKCLYLLQHFLALPLGPALPLALWALWTGTWRWRALVLPGAVLAGSLFLFPILPVNFWTLDRFVLPLEALLLVLAGKGLLELARRFPRPAPWVIGCLALCWAGWVAEKVPSFSLDRQTLRYDYAMDLLRSAPRDTLLFAEGDEDVFPLYYLQEALEKRKDVRTIPSFLLFESWGVVQTARRFPDLGLPGPEAFPGNPIGRMSGSAAEIWVRNRDKVPIAFTPFRGALHRYVLPAYPELGYRRMGLLGMLQARPLRGLQGLRSESLRVRALRDGLGEKDPSLQGMLQVYASLGLPR